MEFAPHDWFTKLFGFNETVKDIYEHITCGTNENGEEYLASNVTQSIFPTGTFQIRNISSFLSDPDHLPKRGGGTFNIIVGNGMQTENLYMIDALTMQSHPSNDGATYQAASNFNALEFVGPSQTAADGVTDYIYDFTQGPYLALACPQSIVYRNYFCKHENDSETIGQIDKEIELLGKTPIPVRHGYAMINKSESEALSKSGFDWANEDNYHIAVHSNCPVFITRGSNLDSFKFPENQNIANHVYVAAFNFYGCVCRTEFTMQLSQQLLTAEYKGTVLSGWENSIQMEKEGRAGAKKLYLTLIGGGVFNNPSEVIANAILNCEQFIVDSGLEVSLICFSKSDYARIQQYLDPLVEKTGGKIIQAQ